MISSENAKRTKNPRQGQPSSVPAESAQTHPSTKSLSAKTYPKAKNLRQLQDLNLCGRTQQITRVFESAALTTRPTFGSVSVENGNWGRNSHCLLCRLSPQFGW